MSRHRDVRSMNYSDEYDGYDDVYGHSVEDDYSVSPGAEQFLFDRNKQQKISSFFTEPDIKEDNEEEAAAESERYQKSQLSDVELAQLGSCIEAVRNVIGETVSESGLVEKIIKSNFNVEVVLDSILSKTPPKSTVESAGANKDRSGTHPGFSTNSLASFSAKSSSSSFAVPKLRFGSKKNQRESDSSSEKLGNASPSSFGSLSALMANHVKSAPSKSFSSPRAEATKKSFGTLADLTAHHLQKSNSPIDRAENLNVAGNSPKTNFVIPKFSSARGTASNNSIAHSPFFVLASPHNPVAPLEKSISDVRLSTEADKENLSKDTAKPEIHERTTTSDILTVDLSTALRQTDSKLSVKSAKDSKKVKVHNSDIIPVANIEPSVACANFILDLECKLNSIHLGRARLTHFNGDLSPFGKMLCKRWRSRRPYIKNTRHHQQLQQQQHHHHSKRVVYFDFSTPSPDSIILSTMRRR